MNKQRHHILAFLGEWRGLLALSAPILLFNLAAMGMGFVDTTMAGRASANDLAAVAIGSSLWMPPELLMYGLLLVLVPVTAGHRGAGASSSVAHDLVQTLWIALSCALLTLVYMRCAEPVLVAMEVAPEIVPVARDYLQALAWGVPGVALFFTLNSFCSGMGNTRAPMVIAVIGLLVNIPANYVLIYGKLGLPAMGAVGCGWATSLSYWVMTVCMLLYISRHAYYGALLRACQLRLCLVRIKELLRLGIPMGINVFMGGSVFALVALLVGKLGSTSVAAHQVVLSFSSLTYTLPMSLAQGITIRVGFVLGQGDQAQARVRVLGGMLLSVACSATSALMILLFPGAILALYTSDTEVASMAVALLMYAACYQVFDALQASANGALRGYRDTYVPMMLVAFSCWVIALPLGYFLGLTDRLVPAMGPAGFWLGLLAGLVLTGTLLSGRLFLVMRRHMAGAESPVSGLRAAPEVSDEQVKGVEDNEGSREKAGREPSGLRPEGPRQ